ncbi:endonuclease G, mitochondrial-like [Palaemon carinicauda]|uniref:endonuclease G, mitochondrial-like n=1 Tax=Palaemon carinicauda TaxID=392227 RepID=UPI0035B5DB2D
MQISYSNPQSDYSLLGNEIESVDQEKDLSTCNIISKDFKFTKPSLKGERKHKKLLGYIKRQLKYRNKDSVLQLYTSLTFDVITVKIVVIKLSSCKLHRSSENRDYKGSGFDRGHMAAAGNHRLSQEICHQTFLLSNMAPQVGRGFNRDKWNDLEQYCRKKVFDNANVYVCTGPLYIPRREEDGKLYVKYQVLGQSHVAVPTHFFKVMVTETNSGELELESFLLPNVAIDDATPLSTFYVPAEVIERASGLLMFDRINRSKFAKVNGAKIGWF